MEKEKLIVVGLVIGLVITGIFGGASYVEYKETKEKYDELVKEHNESSANWQSKYTALQNQYNTLQAQYNVLQANYNTLQNKYNSLNSTYHNYKDMVEMRIPDSGAEKRGFLTPDDMAIKTKAASILGGAYDNDLSTHEVYEINNWVYDNIDYNNDVYVGEKGHIGKECWQYPSETLSLGYGDCEDKALLVASLCLAQEKVNWLYCAEVELTKDGRKSHHMCIFVNVEGDKLHIFDPSFQNKDFPYDGGWRNTESRIESSALDEYRKENGYDSVRVMAVFNLNIYKTFSSNEDFYNWF